MSLDNLSHISSASWWALSQFTMLTAEEGVNPDKDERDQDWNDGVFDVELDRCEKVDYEEGNAEDYGSGRESEGFA